MIKGNNRRMFRKPGTARQAIGILASSKELMDAAQAGQQMPTQPVQSFAGGGIANSYLFDALGILPPGLRQVGEGDDATLEPVPGFGGAYQRLSGISDPARARQQSGIDLLKLGARIAGGQSTSATENIAQGVTTTLGEIDKGRQQELANTLAIAKLQDDKRKQRETLAAARLNRRVTAMSKLATELQGVGVTVNPDTAQFDFVRKGKVIGSYDNFTDIPFNENERNKFEAALEKSGKITDQKRTSDSIYEPDVDFGRAMTELILQKNFDAGRQDEAILAAEAEKAARARGFGVLPGQNKKGIDTRFIDNVANEDGTFNVYDIRGRIVGTATK